MGCDCKVCVGEGGMEVGNQCGWGENRLGTQEKNFVFFEFKILKISHFLER